LRAKHFKQIIIKVENSFWQLKENLAQHNTYICLCEISSQLAAIQIKIRSNLHSKEAFHVLGYCQRAFQNGFKTHFKENKP